MHPRGRGPSRRGRHPNVSATFDSSVRSFVQSLSSLTFGSEQLFNDWRGRGDTTIPSQGWSPKQPAPSGDRTA